MKHVRMAPRQKVRRSIILTSFLVLPVTLYYFSPMLPLQGIAEGIVAGSLATFAAQFIVSILLGRFFCGWLCPAGGLQEAVSAVQDRRVSRRAGIGKWIVWYPWIALLLVMIVRRRSFSGVSYFYQTAGGVSVADAQSLLIYFSVAGLFFLLSLVVGRRAGCHTVCWMAPFMIVGRRLSNLLRLPALRLVLTPEKCTRCGTCTGNCPMSIPVSDLIRRGDLEHASCILCGMCADGCARKAIRFGFRRPAQPGT